MTVRLLCAYGVYPANAIVTLDAGTEAGLIASKLADSNLTGGVTYVAPVESAPRATDGQYTMNAAKTRFVGRVEPDGTVTRLVTVPPAARRPTTLHAVPPTIAYSATAPVSGKSVLPWKENATLCGGAAAYNSSNGTIDLTSATYAGVDVVHVGDVITLGWRCQVAAAERVMVYVDGLPCMAAVATPSVVTTVGSYCYVTLTFASIARRRVEILVSAVAALVGMWVPFTAAVQPGPVKRREHIVGDSFMGGSAALALNSLAPPFILALTYDMSVTSSGLSGTGYTSAGSFTVFGSATRIADAVAIQPHGITFVGSVNDDGASGIQAAASACWAAYAAALPDARITVFGPQPTNATSTLGANRTANNVAVYTATLNNPNVKRFYDLIGNKSGSTLRAFAAFTFYDPGELVTHIGSVWRHEAVASSQYPATGAPGLFTYPAWTLLTADVFGTGQVGTTTANGNRDTLIHSDGVHPTANLCAAYAERIAGASSIAD